MGTHVDFTHLGLDAEHTILQLVNNAHATLGASPWLRALLRRIKSVSIPRPPGSPRRSLHRLGNRCTVHRLPAPLAAPSPATPAPSRASTAIPTPQPPPAHRECSHPSFLYSYGGGGGGRRGEDAKARRPAPISIIAAAPLALLLIALPCRGLREARVVDHEGSGERGRRGGNGGGWSEGWRRGRGAAPPCRGCRGRRERRLVLGGEALAAQLRPVPPPGGGAGEAGARAPRLPRRARSVLPLR